MVNAVRKDNVIAEVFVKKTAKTPAAVLDACRRRLKEYDDA